MTIRKVYRSTGSSLNFFVVKSSGKSELSSAVDSRNAVTNADVDVDEEVLNGDEVTEPAWESKSSFSSVTVAAWFPFN